ncbi:Neuropeptide-Like Protein [Caenorhabditis elegans]|uniref:Neuropeptide-Like Protein n=1 Tax=Caenorhabditis elegans TaxID=6239 RepID=Q7YX47_CAEEL|nr:Neuropeptide-Like Protein [Caenorhabditis elegans]CAE17766.1 Neuropeptide-Like Protein [Caenorhabditis elegans]|eukprot:NP_001021208.1 Neuropeptide-Like Protein [Caenorhabditis elegans]
MMSSRRIVYTLLLITIALCAYSTAYAPRNIRGVGDVPSMFFSPFRMMGKRNQFYGLFKKIRSNEVVDY